jgi:hypothetical protein
VAIKEEIHLVGVDKTKRAFGSVQKSLGRLEKNTGSVAGAFSRLQTIILGAVAAVGAFKVSKDFLNTAVEVENLAIQLKFLTGSAEEGAAAFDTLVDFAANVPFQLQEIANSAPNLLTVVEGTDELNQVLGITGDIAAATGLSFKQTAEQLQRAFSGGIAAADMFREKGVKALLGFEEGVRYTGAQTKKHIIDAFTNGTAVMVGASAEMADTWTGTMSMLGDKLFKFQKKLMESGPFDFLKQMMKLADDALNENFGSIEKAAESMGAKIVEIAEKVLVGGARMIDAISPVVRFIGDSIGEIIKTTNQLPAVIKALGVFGFLALGIKGKAVVVAIGAALKPIKGMFAEIFELQAKATRIARDYTPFLSDERKRIMTQNIEEMTNAAKKLRGEMDDLEGEEPDDTIFNVPKFFDADADIKEVGKYEKAVLSMLDKIEKATVQSKLDEHKDKIQLIAADIEAEKAAKRIAAKEAADEALKNQEKLHKLMLFKQKTFQKMVTEAEQKEAKKQLFIAVQLNKKKMEMQQKIRDAEKAFREEQTTMFKSYSEGFIEEMEKQSDVFENLRQAGANAFSGLTNLLTDFVTTGKFKFKDFANMVIRELVRIAVQAAITFAMKKIAGSFFGIPFLAEGGPAQAGKPYIVGEQGPELFVPKQDGNVIPNNEMSRSGSSVGGKKDITINFTVNAIDANSFQDALGEQRDMIVNIVNEAVMDGGKRAIA